MTPPAHLLDLLERAETNGFSIVDGRGETSGVEFAARVRTAAAALGATGFAVGDRLLVHLEKGTEQVVALWAAALAGGLAVVAHPRLKDDQVGHLLADARPFAVVTSEVRDLVLRDRERVWRGQRVLSFDQLLAGGGAFDPGVDRDGDQPAIVLYSSGSTGAPKGIVQSHRTLVDGARIVADALGSTGADRILAVLALSFDYGLNQVLGAAWVGAQVVLRDYLGGADLVAAIEQAGATVLAGVPPVWHDLVVALGSCDPARIGSLRILTNSGGRWLPSDIEALRQALPGARLYSMYGLTEAFRTSILPPEELVKHPLSVGYPVEGVEVLLVDPETGAVIPGEGVGELVHGGAFVGEGYWEDPEATAQRFRADPRGGDRPVVVCSGDLVRRDRDGRLFFEARLDHQLKVDGYRVSPDEVVDAVSRFEGVAEAAVVGVDGGVRGHRLVLFAVGDVDPKALRAACRAALPAHLVPADIRVVEALPRTNHGKVDGVALRAWALAAN